MLKIGNDYEITADKYQHILNTRSNGKDKDGNSKDQWNKTFHATFDQAAKAIINTEMVAKLSNVGVCENLSQFMNDMRQAVKEIADNIKSAE